MQFYNGGNTGRFQHITTDGTSIYYQIFGVGEPLVLLHGLSASSRWWQRNQHSLAKYFEVHAIDLAGFGMSSGQDFDLEHSALVIAGWMDKVGLGQASFAGHSMGGYIALDMARRFPERVKQLVLIDSLALPVTESPLKHSFGLLNTIRNASAGFLPILINDAWRSGPRTLTSAIRQVFTANLRPHLENIHTPARIIWGANDAILPLKIGKELNQALPNSELVVIRNAGHVPMWDQPAAFNNSVINFLIDPPLPAPVPSRAWSFPEREAINR